MKKITIIALMAAFCLSAGCKSDKIYIIDGNTSTNTVPVGAFQDETYIWEGWFFGTNRIDETRGQK